MEPEASGTFAPIARIGYMGDTVTVYGWKALAGSVIGYAMDGFDLLIVASCSLSLQQTWL